VVAVVVAIILGGVAYDRADAGPGRSADEGSLEAATEDRAKEGPAARADERAFTWANAALIAAMIVMIVAVVATVVVAAAAAVTHAIIKIVVVVLRGDGEKARREQKWSDEDRFSQLGHPKLDARRTAGGGIYCRARAEMRWQRKILFHQMARSLVLRRSLLYTRLEETVVSLWRICGVGVAGVVLFGQVAGAQTAKPKSRSSAKAAMAVWTPEVQQTLGVTASDFTAEGLNKLTKSQLAMLLESAKPDPNKHLLICPANGTVPAGRIRVLVTVAGDDSTGQIAGQIRQAVGSLTGVDVVDAAANADRELNVVIQEQTTGKRTIGFTASYLTGTPCTEQVGDKKTDVELKGTLGSYTEAKGPGLAQDLAGMLDQDLQSLRGSAVKAP
jgi:hypothetical protein